MLPNKTQKVSANVGRHATRGQGTVMGQFQPREIQTDPLPPGTHGPSLSSEHHSGGRYQLDDDIDPYAESDAKPVSRFAHRAPKA